MPKIEWRDGQDDEREAFEREWSASHPVGESMTVQSGREDADINVIVRRFGIGEGAWMAPSDPRYYGDLSNAPRSLREVLDIQREAVERFAQLPVALRNRFDNDPALLFDFVSREENAAMAVELGLLRKPEAPPSETAAPPPSSTSSSSPPVPPAA